MQYIDMLYRLAVSLWAGGNAIFTLMLTPILFKTESRDTAARIVGNLFPGYFRWGVACGVIALLCRLAGRGFELKLPVIDAGYHAGGDVIPGVLHGAARRGTETADRFV